MEPKIDLLPKVTADTALVMWHALANGLTHFQKGTEQLVLCVL